MISSANNSDIHRPKKGEEIANHLPKRLFSLREAATYLGKGLYGVREMVWRGEIPIVRSGRKMFIDLRDLDTWIEARKETYV